MDDYSMAIPVAAYQEMQRSIKELGEELSISRGLVETLEDQLSQIRDIVAPAEDGSENGSEPEPTLTTTADDISLRDWYAGGSATCDPLTSILYDYLGGAH